MWNWFQRAVRLKLRQLRTRFGSSPTGLIAHSVSHSDEGKAARDLDPQVKNVQLLMLGRH